MERNTLLKAQKNDVLKVIKSTHLDPLKFKWVVTTSRCHEFTRVPKLIYGEGKYFFIFDITDFTERYAVFSPGREHTESSKLAGTWKDQLICVNEWLMSLEREVNDPDLWSELEKYRITEDPGFTEGSTNDPFTVHEVEQIVLCLDTIKENLETHIKDNVQHREFVDKKLNYLADAAKRQGRRDWIHTSIGVIVTISIALALAPEQARNIWSILKTAFSEMLKLPQ